MIWVTVQLIFNLFMCFYVLYDLILSIKNIKYQKLWDEKKALRLKIDPAISSAELCKLYVIFCKKYNCKVDF